MKIAYLMNIYPVTSATFIRREIRELEKLDVDINRYAIRRWDEDLVDPDDREEAERTHYILSGNVANLIKIFISTVVRHPKGFLSMLRLWLKIVMNAKGMVIQHVAYLMYAVYLFRQLSLDGVRHIHAHYSTNTAAVAMLCRKMGGPTYSFTAHGPDEFDAPEHASIREKVAEAEFVVAITDFCKSQLVRFSSFEHWDKIHPFRCGVSLEELVVSNEPFENNYTLVCVGRLTDLKGQLLFPKVAKSLVEKYPDLKIILIGDGPSRPALEAQISANNLETVIELRGWQTNAEVKQVIQSSRALILPSFAEGLPIVFMESLALGRPVLATYIAGIPELVDEKCGWIVPAGSEASLKDALDDILSSSADVLVKKGEVGRQRIEEQHSIAILANNLATEFKKASGI